MTNNDFLKIFQDCDFTDIGLDEQGGMNYINKKIFEKLNIPKGVDYEHYCGASKLVFIFWDSKEKNTTVIKIPFQGEYHYIYDTESEDYDKLIFERFSGSDTDNGWDYCEKEVENYKIAEKEGLSFLFAKTEFIGTVNKYPIYKQEYVEYTNANDKTYDSKEINKKTGTICEEKNFFNIEENWLRGVCLYYGGDILEKLIDFIIDNCIYDLHEANIGYNNGAPIIFDYSDFNS